VLTSLITTRTDSSSRLSEKETDKQDKLMPSVNYLQRLGPEYLDQVFEYSRWVFEQDVDIGFEVRRTAPIT
jgi:Vam6/Vps39-like protein vacuolar protein sorting-associated protein 39